MVTVSQGSTTFTITESLTTGNFSDGPAYVIVPSGNATLTAATPAATTQFSRDCNGAMLNPNTLFSGNSQGFDERMDDKFGGTQSVMDANYSSSVNATNDLPLTLSAGDIFLKSVKHDFNGGATFSKDQSRFGIIDEMNVLFVIDWTPGAEEPAPPAVSWSGRTLTQLSYTDTLANIVASLPSRSLTGIAQHSVTDVISWIDYFDCGYGLTYGTTTGKGRGYQCLMVNNPNLSFTNYGQYKAAVYHSALWHLIGDVATSGQKQTLLKWVIQLGVQNAFPYLHAQTAFGGNGAHHQFHQCVGLWAIKYTTGHGLNLSDFASYAQGNLFAQIFEFDSNYITNNLIFHDDSTKPRTYRRHTVTNVSGTSVTTNTPTGAFQAKGLRMVRESDGAEAVITSLTNSGSACTIDAQPSPAFAVNDVVNYQRDPAPVAGDVDWDIRAQQKVTEVDKYNPSTEASYRKLQEATGIGPCVDVGAWHTSLDYAWKYVKQSFTANEPTAANEWPVHGYDVNSTKMNQESWEGLWPSIEADLGGTGLDPTLSTTSPADNATDVDPDSTIVLTFDKAVALGTGNIVLRDNDGGFADLETFNVATGTGDNGGTVTVSGSQVTITPGASMATSIEHAVRVAATAIDDTESPVNSYAGITDDTTISFTTAASAAPGSGEITLMGGEIMLDSNGLIMVSG